MLMYIQSSYYGRDMKLLESCWIISNTSLILPPTTWLTHASEDQSPRVNLSALDNKVHKLGKIDTTPRKNNHLKKGEETHLYESLGGEK